MSIFNSLGSNYDFSFLLKTLGVIVIPPRRWDLELKNLLQNKYQGKAVLLYKGREAIELALKTLNLPKGSFVAINGFTCFAVYEAVKKAGLNCEYLDIDKGELNFSANTLRQAIEKNPQIKAVIIQNTLGFPCQIEEISRICKENNLVLIADLAHSVGTRYANGQEAGTISDLVALSFSQDKMIDAISGGALIERGGAKLDQLESGSDWHLPPKQQIDRLYPFFTYLIRKTYPFGMGKILHFILKNLKLLSNPMAGGEDIHKLPAWYCKLAETQFKKLALDLDHRKTIASIYAKLINPKILSPKLTAKIYLSSNIRFPIFVENRGSLIKYLEDREIYVSDIWYDAPIAPKKYLSQTDYQEGQCPNSELASSAILNLPTHKNVSEKQAEKISNLINLWLKSN